MKFGAKKQVKKIKPGLIEKVFNYFEDFRQTVYLRINSIALFSVLLFFFICHQLKNRFPNMLPESINIFSHIGNVDSIVPALIAGIAFGWILTHSTKMKTREVYLGAIFIGVLTGFIANLLIELPLGMRLLSEYNVSDPWDVVWGTLFCLIACALVFDTKELD